ncbi:MAG: methyltransferase domain-containing protein [Candidatus Paceibacterota bacterium]|jgi:ubiquinone/menaquinone biosynthesis C-methylase UbiE
MKTSWGGVAGWYDDVVNDDDSYQGKVILPNIIRIMAPEKGKSVLDLACGQGVFARALAAKGARVTGIDIAPELIRIAQKHAGHNEEYFVSPADNIGIFRDGSFDDAMTILAIQNIEHAAKAFREVSRTLKPKGRFIVVLNHPAFRIPGKTSWGWDIAVGSQYRRVDEYLSESRKAIDMHPGTPQKDLTYSFHRPLQNYSKMLANAGFAILRIEEWMSHRESEKGPRKIAEDKARNEIPMFMCLECVKIPL